MLNGSKYSLIETDSLVVSGLKELKTTITNYDMNADAVSIECVNNKEKLRPIDVPSEIGISTQDERFANSTDNVKGETVVGYLYLAR